MGTEERPYNRQCIQEKLTQLNDNKRERIINAAMKEFTKGYKKASTDVIVREAGISKGLLFYYFGTKKDLFLYISDISIDMMASEYLGLINIEQGDILERIGQMTLLKMELCRKYPKIFDFLLEVYFGRNGDAEDMIHDKKTKMFSDAYAKLFDGIDMSLFRDDVDRQKALKLIMFMFRGYAEEETDKERMNHSHELDFERYVKELDEYMDIMRKCFYKNA